MPASLVAKIQSAIATKDVQVLADAVAEAKKAMAELAKWIQHGEDAMAKISPSTLIAVKKGEDKKMADEWTFFFMNRDTFLNLPQLEGGVPRHQGLRKEGKLFERRVSLEEVVTRRLARTSVVFSHRWFEPTHPDPDNVKLLKAQEFAPCGGRRVDGLVVRPTVARRATAHKGRGGLLHLHLIQHQHVVPRVTGCALSFVLLSVRCCFCSFCSLFLVIWRFPFE